MTYLVLLFTLLTIPCVVAHSGPKPPLLVVSFDGFRWDYLKRAKLPHIERVIREGVHARQGVKNIFDTSTLPNHWTLVTGLYPESHGILGNYMRDVNIEKKFIPKYVDPKYNNDPRYYDDGGEPIWATNQFQGGRSGVVMWWGSDNAVKWSRPTFQMAYDDTVNSTRRVDVMLDWLTHQEYPINLGLLYFPQPDHIGHKAGPESSNVTEAIKDTDAIIGYILNGLERAGMLENINIILTSDHGMTTTSNKTLIYLDEIIDLNDYDILAPECASASIFPHEGKLDKVYTALKEASEKPDSHFRVYLLDDIPERFHMKNNERAPPVLAIADLHYVMLANKSRDDEFILAGAHGYDNEELDMRPFFVAMGPSFKSGVTVNSFNSVDVYPLMCLLLGIEPAPNNGSLEIVSTLVAEHKKEETTITTFGTYILALVVITAVGGAFAVAACRQHRYLKRRKPGLKLTPLDARLRGARYNRAAHSLLRDDYFDDDDDEDDDDFETLEGVITNGRKT